MGGNVVIHAGTTIGEGVTIQDGAIVGKPPKLGARSVASAEPPLPAAIGDGAAVCAARWCLPERRLAPAPWSATRPRCASGSMIGAETVIGRGARSTTTSRSEPGQGADQLLRHGGHSDRGRRLVGPGVTLTNDNTMGPTLAHRTPCSAPRLLVGGGAVICPGIEIGEEAFVGAGAVVTADVPARAVVVGVPAKQIREVGEDDLLERWS